MYLSFKFQSDRTTNTEVMQVSLTLQHCLRLRVCFSFCRRACKSEKSLHGRGVCLWQIVSVFVAVFQHWAKGILLSGAVDCSIRLVVAAAVRIGGKSFVVAFVHLFSPVCMRSPLFALSVMPLLSVPFRSILSHPSVHPHLLWRCLFACSLIANSLQFNNFTLSRTPTMARVALPYCPHLPPLSACSLLPWHHPRLAKYLILSFPSSFLGPCKKFLATVLRLLCVVLKWPPAFTCPHIDHTFPTPLSYHVLNKICYADLEH